MSCAVVWMGKCPPNAIIELHNRCGSSSVQNTNDNETDGKWLRKERVVNWWSILQSVCVLHYTSRLVVLLNSWAGQISVHGQAQPVTPIVANHHPDPRDNQRQTTVETETGGVWWKL